LKCVAGASGCLLVAMVATGCGLLPTGGHPSVGPASALSPMGHGLREYRAAFHVHCYLSHDSDGPIEVIASSAKALGIDTVILNDHYEAGNVARAPRGVQHGVLFLPGLELRAGQEASILAFDVREDFDNKLSGAGRLAEMHRQGAVSVIGHVEEVKDWNAEPFQGPFDAFEVYNLHAQFKEASRLGIALRLLTLAPDAFFAASIENPTANLALWDHELARGRRLAGLAGHDAHANVRVFGQLGGTIGTYAELFRLFSNHILSPEWTVEGIADGVRRGRTFVTFDFLGDGTGFAVSYGAKGAAADARAILGDTVPYRSDHVLQVRVPPEPAPPKNAAPARQLATPLIRVLRDGEEIGSAQDRTLDMPLPGAGVYRVEVYRGNRLWIVASPMYITP
jgi:hypothetical protein